jgi:peptidoglycan/xylan/chitin deacetylase (PgdA/CDA1 family)
MRDKLRQFGLSVFAHAGRWISSKKEMILTYHSIDPSGSIISIHPDIFQWQMEFLKNSGRRGVSLREYLSARATSSASRSRLVALTFDDGFENFYAVALPTLLQYGFTATVFIVTGSVGDQCKWEKKNGIPELELMPWHQIRECHEQGIEIGSHTVDHVNLVRLEPDYLKKQVVQSKKHIESNFDTEVTSFCYPYGGYDRNSIDQVQKAGYQAAVTRQVAYLDSEVKRFELPRLGMNRIDPVDRKAQKLYFRAAESGMLTHYDRTRNMASSILRKQRIRTQRTRL